MPLVIAHRGASIEAPENTIAAFKKAEELNSAFIEVDIHETTEGEFAVIHDRNIKRLTKVNKDIVYTSHFELKSFEVGSWFNSAFANEKIPYLHELYQLNLKAFFMIEIKTLFSIQNLKRYLEKKCSSFFVRGDLLGAFSKEIIQELTDLFPIEKIIGIADEEENIETFCQMGLKYLAIGKSLLDTDQYREWQRHSYLWVWTVNDRKTFKKCLEKSVNGIITDNPRKVYQWLHQGV